MTDDPTGKPKGMNTGYIIAGVLVLALIVWGIYARNQKNKTADDNQSTNQEQSSNASPTSTEESVDFDLVKVDLSYEKAIKAYPYRFQFSKCSGTPGTLTVKKGSIVMLDNRDAVAHTFKANNQTFKIAGYGYALLKTSAITNANITCDGGG